MFLLNPFVFSQSGGYALDPAKVKLLLHFDGNYNDSSPNNHAMTSGGNISIDTTDTKFGSGKLQFGIEPRNGYLRTTNTLFNFGENQPFTLCFWSKGGDGNGCYATATPFVLSKGAVFLFRNEPPLYDKSYENWIFVPFSVTDLNNWVHIAVVADGSRIKGYLNGVQQFNMQHPNWPSENCLLEFGSCFGQYNNGTLDEVLLYSEALWTADFTPPTAPFTY